MVERLPSFVPGNVSRCRWTAAPARSRSPLARRSSSAPRSTASASVRSATAAALPRVAGGCARASKASQSSTVARAKSPHFEALVAQIVAAYAAGHDPAREAAWIAELDGRRVGCVFCVADDDDPEAAKLRILLVHPGARGHGLGGRLVDTCLRFARDAGYARMRLWTNHPLAAARQIYVARGFTLAAEEPHHSFGVDLVGQTYVRELGA